jgi:putative membrane protein
LKNDYPDNRTNWAHERTRLAKERTFSAWLRSGLSAVGVGLGLVKLLPSVEPRWMMQTIGGLFIAAGGVIFVMGYQTYSTVIKKLEKDGFEGIPSFFMGVLTAIMLLGAILGFILILMD